MPPTASQPLQPFWSDDPRVLVRPEYLLQVLPQPQQPRAANLNAIVRLLVYVALVLKLIGLTWWVFLLPVLGLVGTYGLHRQRAPARTQWDTWVDGALTAASDAVEGVAERTAVASGVLRGQSQSESGHEGAYVDAEDSDGSKEGFAVYQDAADVYESVHTTHLPRTPAPVTPEASAFSGCCAAPDGRRSRYADASSPAPARQRCLRSGVPKDRGTRRRASSSCTAPTPTNPFGNMTLIDMHTDPARARACTSRDQPATPLRQTRAFAATGITDPGDVFEHTSSQRQYFRMPWTTMPNDPDGDFGHWLYDGPPTKKEEGLIMVPVGVTV